MPVQFLSDNGDDVYYGDGIAAKDLANNELKKFRSDIVSVQAAVPTAANVSVAGRVQSAEGLGIGNTRVSVMNATTGAVLSARTNSFGIFTISGLFAGETYIFEVRAKQYSFAPLVLNISEEITDLRFVAEP